MGRRQHLPARRSEGKVTDKSWGYEERKAQSANSAPVCLQENISIAVRPLSSLHAIDFPPAREDLLSLVDGFQFVKDFVGCNQLRSQTLQFGQRSVPNFRGQGFNRVTDHRHAPLPLQQTLDRATD